MPKVRIVLLTNRITMDYGCYEEVEKILACGLTEWEEVSQENLDFLRKHERELLDLVRKTDSKIQTALVLCDTESVVSRTQSLNALIEKEKRSRTAKQKAEEKRKAEYDRKRKATALERTKQRLAKLQAELEEVE